MPRFLHVGCGHKRKGGSTPGFDTAEWREIRLDIDANVEPDVVATITDMRMVADASMDAVYSSHNLEHLYSYEVPAALAEFRRVLRPDGFAVVTCPDLQSVCALVADDKLMEPAYVSPAGPIAPLDILFGLRSAVTEGCTYMAHRGGFTARSLFEALKQAGFSTLIGRRRPRHFDLWFLASAAPLADSAVRRLAGRHFPVL